MLAKHVGFYDKPDGYPKILKIQDHLARFKRGEPELVFSVVLSMDEVELARVRDTLAWNRMLKHSAEQSEALEVIVPSDGKKFFEEEYFHDMIQAMKEVLPKERFDEIMKDLDLDPRAVKIPKPPKRDQP